MKDIRVSYALLWLLSEDHQGPSLEVLASIGPGLTVQWNRIMLKNADLLSEVQALGKWEEWCPWSFVYVHGKLLGFLMHHYENLWDIQFWSGSLGFPRPMAPQQPSCSRAPTLTARELWEPQLSLLQSSDTVLGKHAGDPSISRRSVN